MILPESRGWQLAIVSATLASLAVVAPARVRAEPFNVDLTLNVYGPITYDSVFQQAESLARQLLFSSFAQDPSVSEVNLVVLADRNGQIIPLMSVNVSRVDWRDQPDVNRWIAWTAPFFSSETLLGLGTDTSEGAADVSPLRVDDIDALEDDPAFRDD